MVELTQMENDGLPDPSDDTRNVTPEELAAALAAPPADDDTEKSSPYYIPPPETEDVLPTNVDPDETNATRPRHE